MRYASLLATSLSLVLFAGGTAFADPITETFTISDLSGPLGGNTYTGSFTLDPSVSGNLTAFSTDFPSWVTAVSDGATLADFTFAIGYYDSSLDIYDAAVFYAPGPVGNEDAFNIFNANSLTYGETEDIGTAFSDFGEGTVTYGSPSNSVVPEPASWLLFATGALGTLVAARRNLPA
jgi:hypothetical protein